MIKNPTINEALEKFKANKHAYDTFDNVVTNMTYWRRELMLGAIEADTGDAIEAMIRFWNIMDDEENLPIEQRRPILLYIDSPGGDLVAAFTIIDSIRMSKTPVYTINTGAAYSGGFFTFIAGHKRYTYPHASFLYHEGSTEVGGDAGKFQNFSDFYKKQLAQLKDITLEYTNISEELYQEKRRDDWWISADEAIKLGVADEIIDSFELK